MEFRGYFVNWNGFIVFVFDFFVIVVIYDNVYEVVMFICVMKLFD